MSDIYGIYAYFGGACGRVYLEDYKDLETALKGLKKNSDSNAWTLEEWGDSQQIYGNPYMDSVHGWDSAEIKKISPLPPVMKCEALKPLVWEGLVTSEMYSFMQAETPFGNYSITMGTRGLHWSYCFDEYKDEDWFYCDSVEHGKILAWNHWVERMSGILTDSQSLVNDLSMLVSFLAGIATTMNSKRLEALAIADDSELRKFMSLKFPVLQGTKNTFDLMEVSNKISFNQDALHRAMEHLLGDVSGNQHTTINTDDLARIEHAIRDNLKGANYKNEQLLYEALTLIEHTFPQQGD